MRFKFKTILLSGILLAGGGLNAQKNAWAMFSPSSNYLNLQISSSTSNWGQTLPRLKNPRTNQYFTSYLGFNVQTDITGKPLFYVLSTIEETFLFDRNGIWVPVEEQFQIKKTVLGGYTNYECSPEITIIPLEPGVIYHILSSGKIWEYNLTSNTIDNKNFKYGTYYYPGYNFSSDGKKNGTAMQACYKISTGNCDEQKYRIYSLKGNVTNTTYRGIAVTEVVVPKNGQNKVTLIHDYDITSINGVSSSFSYYQTEMELSPDATKLSIIEQNKVLVFNVKSDGKIDGLNNTFSFNSNGSA
ncbi:MAG: hypothetical protein IT244_08675, partial [Bacteroidia bacterium]|nr:hypothetical protein [Bacteroidia bacterium]